VGLPDSTETLVAKPVSFSPDEVVRYLLRRKLLTTAESLDARLVVKNLSRRNHVLAVTGAHRSGYLFKQGMGWSRIATLRNEAMVYVRLLQHPGCAHFAKYLPRCYGYNSKQNILLTEFFKDGQDLRSYCTQRKRLPARIGAELGSALAALHRAKAPRRREIHRQAPLRVKPPWVLSIVRPQLSTVFRNSIGVIELLKLLQEFDQFREHFDRLYREWKSESFVHFDLRWDNCMVVPRANRKVVLKIVDWELSGSGDPRWDVGTVFCNFLNFWISGICVTGDTSPAQYLDSAEVPLTRLQPAIRAFWRHYQQEMEISPGDSEAWLIRAVEYAAAGLVRTVFEQASELAALQSGMACLLQVSLNMLEQPAKAAAHLLGIAVNSGRG
jgi:Phosphotransferase enzyme family